MQPVHRYADAMLPMGNIVKYVHEQFGPIRICQSEGKEWFNLHDVCKPLEIANVGNAKSRLSKGGIRIMDTPVTNQYGVTYNQPMTYIDEPNLYRCIFQSRKAEAEQYQAWVFEEVLPQIRRTGSYSLATAKENEQRQLLQLLSSPEGLITVCKTVMELDDKVKQLSPKAEFADAVMASSDTCTVAELAKLIFDMGVQMGQNRLFAWMRDNHYLGSSEHHWNVPQQRWVEAGLFKVKTSEPWYDDAGKAHYNVTPLVTGKGQQYFIDIFMK